MRSNHNSIHNTRFEKLFPAPSWYSFHEPKTSLVSSCIHIGSKICFSSWSTGCRTEKELLSYVGTTFRLPEALYKESLIQSIEANQTTISSISWISQIKLEIVSLQLSRGSIFWSLYYSIQKKTFPLSHDYSFPSLEFWNAPIADINNKTDENICNRKLLRADEIQLEK